MLPPPRKPHLPQQNVRAILRRPSPFFPTPAPAPVGFARPPLPRHFSLFPSSGPLAFTETKHPAPAAHTRSREPPAWKEKEGERGGKRKNVARFSGSASGWCGVQWTGPSLHRRSRVCVDSYRVPHVSRGLLCADAGNCTSACRRIPLTGGGPYKSVSDYNLR